MNNLRNSVQLIGNIGKDPESKQLDNGNQLTRLSIATKDIYQNKQGEKVIDTQWHNLIAWGKTAENMKALLKKGKEIAVFGRLVHRSFEDKQGIKRKVAEVVVNEFLMLN